MIERQVDIATDDGNMPTFVVHPEEIGPHPVVLFQMDAPGIHRVRAAPSIHGVRLHVDADDSPHRRLGYISVEIYVACAESDHYAPPAMFVSTIPSSADCGASERRRRLSRPTRR